MKRTDPPGYSARWQRRTRKRLAELGISARLLAREANVPRSTLGAALRGKTAVVSVDLAFPVDHALDRLEHEARCRAVKSAKLGLQVQYLSAIAEELHPDHWPRWLAFFLHGDGRAG